MFILSAFFFGIFVGILIDRYDMRRGSVGVLNLDHSDPEDRPYIFLELDQSPNEVFTKEYVVLRTSTKNYISHK